MIIKQEDEGTIEYDYYRVKNPSDLQVFGGYI